MCSYANATRAIIPPTRATAGLFTTAAPVNVAGADVVADAPGTEGKRVDDVGLTGAKGVDVVGGGATGVVGTGAGWVSTGVGCVSTGGVG